ncbi:uncharacterized protein NP_5346A [Natronomonas pharaonis DSM 2160]|uniref:Uncharacterized protein n=1 Tax=Natronomonas pharaonis (strain ATCC 35678 / DSM 2160 / CIP 103997 / JCM 8858 / NBRC 14720 / NCIMB 2260 / Gabara) TaxID=348780 RepID=A0A1Q2UA73_NATPD|nr:uncharacterized protein NP_2344A [Natronomonas pharaonis DSM 2160]CAI50764.2 uncharacterized protein NP_5346A [Natronomonas pharaonis DSM 2160]
MLRLLGTVAAVGLSAWALETAGYIDVLPV